MRSSVPRMASVPEGVLKFHNDLPAPLTSSSSLDDNLPLRAGGRHELRRMIKRLSFPGIRKSSAPTTVAHSHDDDVTSALPSSCTGDSRSTTTSYHEADDSEALASRVAGAADKDTDESQGTKGPLHLRRRRRPKAASAGDAR